MDFNLFRQKPYARNLSLVFCLFALVATFFAVINFNLARNYIIPENVQGATTYGLRWSVAALACIFCVILSKAVLDWILLRVKTRLVRVVELKGHGVNHVLDEFGNDTVTVEFKVGEQNFALSFKNRSFDGNIIMDENFYFLFELRFDRNHRLIGAKCLEDSV